MHLRGMVRMENESVVTTKIKSRQEILHYILSFCMSRITAYTRDEDEHPKTHGSFTGFVSDSAQNPVKIGDLVLLSAAPVSKWKLGWLSETRENHPGYVEYLIESLEDGELCWWGNVGISFLHRHSVQEQWRWSDRQWSFKKRWWDVCYKEKDAYITLPLFPVFGDGYEVTLGTRTRFGLDDMRPSRTFPDWRKVTRAMMAQCYDDCVSERATGIDPAQRTE